MRNGLGHTTEAVVDDSAADQWSALDLSVLRLNAPLEQGTAVLAPTDPFAGSPSFVVEYPGSADATPAWPTLHEGFLGAFTGRDGWRRLGIDLAPGRFGAPVFDVAGRLAGISLQGPTEAATTLRVVASVTPEGTPPARTAHPQASARMAADETYERALGVTLQVLASP